MKNDKPCEICKALGNNCAIGCVGDIFVTPYQASTIAAKCSWCGNTGNLQPIKVSPTETKMACGNCYRMMKPEPPQMNFEYDVDRSTGWKAITIFGWKRTS